MTSPGSEYAALWEAVAEQADAWKDLPVVRRLAAPLPRNADQRSTGLPGLLQHVTASGGEVAARPLRLGTGVPMMLPLLASGAPHVPTGVLHAFLDDANRVEGAHRVTVAWLRSRLPGYPQLPAPQLAPATPLTTDEFTYRLTWTRDELGAGFQFQNPPSRAVEILGASPQQTMRADDAARRVALGLAATPAWQRLRSADAALTPAARADLAAARRAIADATRPERIDAHEPDLAMPRDAYRQTAVADALRALSGAAAEYADAFDAADRLVELAASDIFGQLTVYGPMVLTGVTDIAAHGDGPGTIEFSVEDEVHLDTGTVAWLDDPLCPDAVRLIGLGYSFDQAAGMRVRATAERLVGTAATWQRPEP